jgi:hypothetical protein
MAVGLVLPVVAQTRSYVEDSSRSQEAWVAERRTVKSSMS